MKQVPQYSLTSDTMILKPHNKPEEVIDVYGPKEFIRRFIELETNIYFDATILNLNQLITSEIKWIIDSDAKIFNLTKKELFKARSRKVVRVGDGVCWVAGVSYPYEIKKHLIEPRLLLKQYATIVLIDGEWVLYEFSAFKKRISVLKL